MALVLAERVKETTTTTGTGTITLLGASVGFQSFAVIGDGNTTYYTISGQSGGEWEVGIGTYTAAGTTLARTTVIASSNAGALVPFSAGTKDVFVTYPAAKSVNQDASSNVGIGTTSPLAKLDVRGSSTYLVNATNPTAWVSVDSALTTGSIYSQWNTSTSEGVFGSYTNHPIYFVTNNSRRLTIDTSGNVGISAAPVASKGTLQVGTIGYTDTGVVGAFASSVAGYNQLVLQNTSNNAAASANFNVSNDAGTSSANFGELGINSSTFTGTGSFSQAGNVYLASASTDLVVGTYAAKPIRFVVNSGATDAAIIDSSGNVGIGVTPTYKFDVTGVGRITGNANQQYNFRVQYASTGFGLYQDDTTGYTRISAYDTSGTTYGKGLSFATATAGSATAERMAIDSTGDVNIGSATPIVGNRQFLVSNSNAGASSSAQITVGSNAGNLNLTQASTALGGYSTVYATAGVMYVGTQSAQTLNLVTSNTIKSFIDSNGNMVVGTAAASGKLRVSAADGNPILLVNGATLGVRIGASSTTSSVEGVDQTGTGSYQPLAVGGSVLTLTISNVEKAKLDASGNFYVETGATWRYAPAPTAMAAGANAITAAQLQGGLFQGTGATAVTMTLPLATALDTYFSGVPTTNISIDFAVVNTGSGTGIVTVTMNTGITSLGVMTVPITTSAQFRLRRTAANTYICYRV